MKSLIEKPGLPCACGRCSECELDRKFLKEPTTPSMKMDPDYYKRGVYPLKGGSPLAG